MEETTEYIGGIEVTFPYKPYGLQKAYMSQVVSCVSEAKNGLLESPTGTGKTLSLLCSSLAWLKIKREEERKEKGNKQLVEDIEDVFNEKPEKPQKKYMKDSLAPKDWKQKGTRIVYSSRTHMQLSQAIGEMKKTNYSNMKGVVLGSRDQYCLNSEVMRLDNISAKNHACRVKNNHNSCPYYSQFDSKLYSTLDYIETPVHDIEDLVSLGKRHTVCPYYASKALAQRADIIYVPYNYLIDKQARKSQEVGLKDSVIIIDEGHNIERSLEEIASTELSSQSLAACIKYMNTLYDELSGEANNDEEVDENVTKSLKHIKLNDVRNLKCILLDFETELDKYIVSFSDEKVFFPDAMIYQTLERACFDWNILKVIDDITTYLVARSAVAPSVSIVISALQRLEQFFKVLYPENFASGITEINSYQDCFSKNFKVFAVKSQNNQRFQKKKNWLNNKAEVDNSWTLNVMCLTPSVAMKSLLSCGVRSCIITSGTLAPLKTFEAELGTPFPITLQNKHIISSDSLKVFAVGTGKYGQKDEPFNSAYTNRQNEKYYHALGDAISKYCRLIPGGIFLFFSSYTVMDLCASYWKNSGANFWYSIISSKQVFIESKNKHTFDEDFKKFKAKVDEPGSQGAIFFGVCRGKLSEGLDAAEQYCRGVIVVGLPFPSQFESRVYLKKKYLDENQAALSMSSSTWYQLQMTRAVNQAIGRIIRHKDDYGVVVLLDSRFSYRKNDLSSWIRDFFKEASLDESITSIKKFFASKITKKFIEAPQQEKLGLQAGVRRKHTNEPLNSTFLDQYSEGSPIKKERIEKPKSIFDALTLATNRDVNKQFVIPPPRSTIQQIECNVSPIKVESEKRKKLNVPLVSLQPIAVVDLDNSPKKKESEKEYLEKFKEQSRELKRLFEGTKNFDRLCSSLKNYQNHRNIKCFMSEVKWVFQNIEARTRKRHITALSIAISDKHDRDIFLQHLDSENTAQ